MAPSPKLLKSLFISLVSLLPFTAQANPNQPRDLSKKYTRQEINALIYAQYKLDPRLLNSTEKQGLLEILKSKGVVDQKTQSKSSDTTGWDTKF